MIPAMISLGLSLIFGHGAVILTPTVAAVMAAKSPAAVEAALLAMSPAERAEALRLLIKEAPDIIKALRKGKPVLRYIIEQELRRKPSIEDEFIPIGPPIGPCSICMGWRRR